MAFENHEKAISSKMVFQNHGVILNLFQIHIMRIDMSWLILL